MSSRKTRSRVQSPTRKPLRLAEADVPSSAPARDETTRKHKIAAIERALEADPADLNTLRQLAISRGGLISDHLRKKAWPKLLNIDVSNIPEKPAQDVLHGHRDYQQVVLDVNRSLKRFPPGMDEDIRMGMQDQLIDVIMWVLVTNPELHYYQGYHDICVTFLLAVGEDITFALMDKLSNHHLRDFLDQTMDKTKHMLNYLYPIIGLANPEVRHFMEKAEVGTIFCLSWLITWYGHVLNDFRHIVRLYDFFIACHQLMPIYLGAAIVLHRSSDVLACECEMPYVHSLLSKIPDNLPFEHLASYAGDLFIMYPPEKVAEEAERIQLEQIENAKIANAAREDHAKNMARGSKRNAMARHGRHPGKHGRSMMFRVVMWTLFGAVTAVAFTMLSNTVGWKWRS